MACTVPHAYGLQVARWACRSLPQVVVEQAVGDAIPYTRGGHILAQASLQPHRSRHWKTAQLEEVAAKGLWCYEAAEWLHCRGRW